MRPREVTLFPGSRKYDADTHAAARAKRHETIQASVHKTREKSTEPSRKSQATITHMTPSDIRSDFISRASWNGATETTPETSLSHVLSFQTACRDISRRRCACRVTSSYRSHAREHKSYDGRNSTKENPPSYRGWADRHPVVAAGVLSLPVAGAAASRRGRCRRFASLAFARVVGRWHACHSSVQYTGGSDGMVRGIATWMPARGRFLPPTTPGESFPRQRTCSCANAYPAPSKWRAKPALHPRTLLSCKGVLEHAEVLQVDVVVVVEIGVDS